MTVTRLGAFADVGTGTGASPGSASVDVEDDVRHVVLPDDDDDPEPLPWESIVRRLRGSGVLATVQELKQVPYDVVISERLRARIS